jgi:carbamoyltransferase
MDIAVYGWHDSSVCVKDGGKYFVYEFERFANRRYAVMTQQYPSASQPQGEVVDFLSYIKHRHRVPHIDLVLCDQIFDCDHHTFKSVFSVGQYRKFGHHLAHAYGAYAQSPFENCFVISYDGSGENEDGSNSSFTVWSASPDGMALLNDFQPYFSHSLGNCYLALTVPLASIKKPVKDPDNYYFYGGSAGKLMGLAAFGTPVEDWKPHFRAFFDGGRVCDEKSLSDSIGIDIGRFNHLHGQTEFDFAATIQWAFEDKFFRIFDTLGIPQGSSICMTGGCALNINVNQRLADMGYKLFVPPNPSDCGLTLGMLSAHHGDRNIDVTYSGFDILDHEAHGLRSEPMDIAGLASSLFFRRKIVGLIQGSSECGPRALCNRSIICYPDIPMLKERINSDIKFREWFRPFGTVVRAEDIDRFFVNGRESRFMSLCPTLRKEYQFPSITHVDGTCRIQTVSASQNPLAHSLLSELENLGALPILLNTSFNTKGKPILTRLSDAAATLHETKLEGFYYEGRFYERA